MRRRDPDDQQGWGDVPVRALEHPYVRLLQALALLIAILLGLNQLGLLDRPDVDLRTRRVTGADPISASAAVARESHAGGAASVIIAGTGALADGVVATGLAGALDAPILLNEAERLSPQVRDVTRQLDAETAILVGGTTALSEEVRRALEEDLRLEVVRVAGGSRFDTASLVAQLFGTEADVPVLDGLPTALLVPAEDVPAALEAGSLAAARANPMPVLLSQAGGLPDPTHVALESLGVEQLMVVRDPAAPGSGVAVDGFDGPTIPVSGLNGAADAAVSLREYRPPRVVVVPAGDEARTLIAGPLAGRESGVILTADTALAWLESACGTVDELFVVGEVEEIDDAEVATYEDALTACAT